MKKSLAGSSFKELWYPEKQRRYLELESFCVGLVTRFSANDKLVYLLQQQALLKLLIEGPGQ